MPNAIFCTKCGAALQADAAFCAKCGAAQRLQQSPPQPARRAGPSNTAIGIALGVVILVMWVMGSAVRGNVSRQATSAPTATLVSLGAGGVVPEANATARVPTPTEIVYPEIGQDVQVADVRWKVLRAEDVGQTLEPAQEFLDPRTTTGKWIKVRLEVENQSREPQTFAGVDLLDNKGRTFQSSSDATLLLPSDEACILERLNPNLPKVCQIVFEVPADAGGFLLAVGDLKMLGNKEALIALGF